MRIPKFSKPNEIFNFVYQLRNRNNGKLVNANYEYIKCIWNLQLLKDGGFSISFVEDLRPNIKVSNL